MVVPLFVGREKSIAALEEAMNNEKDIFLAAQKNPKTNNPGPDDIYRVGTLGQILQLLRLPDGMVKVLVEGKQRYRISNFLPQEQFFMVELEGMAETASRPTETEALMRSVNVAFENYVKLNKKVPPEMLVSVGAIDDPSRLGDTIAAHLELKLEDKQQLLEFTDTTERLEEVYRHLQGEVEILEIEKRIRGRVKKQMERTQREYYLNEQMRAIQKELGQQDESKNEMQDLEDKLKKKNMPKEAREKALKELKKLKMMSPMSAEATVVRNYIDWIIDLPWNEKTEDRIDLEEVERILDEDHFGLDKAKGRIVEYLAVLKLVEHLRGPILCLVGPPGVGKTSLAKSISKALGRKFVRVSLGGVRDEAEIRGHRRTYIGALPGKVIQSLKKAGSSNPVFLLDEIDKMSSDFRGDPASAMLEVLDPEQNSTFNDHYLDLDYDISDVMFITTANNLYQIPGPLRDRMEVIRIEGYTEIEKLNIAKRHLVNKQLEANGLADKKVAFGDSALLEIIRNYTRESGVRNLEREIASVCRKVARDVVKSGKDKGVRITGASIEKFLGPAKFRHDKIEEKDAVGICQGLAWTEYGGDMLLIEVSVTPGKGKLTLTGKLGDVMQESAHAAMSYVRSRAKELGLSTDFYSNNDIHVHVPEGATPKDGPSAGITLATALTSALTNVPVKRSVAMTGEITLRGRVLPIGGLKEKLLAAHRAGITEVLIPKDNEKDLRDVPQKIKEELQITIVESMDEVLHHALAQVEEKAEKPESLEPAPRADEGTPIQPAH
jgi:ATP-dependent Lon protease